MIRITSYLPANTMTIYLKLFLPHQRQYTITSGKPQPLQTPTFPFNHYTTKRTYSPNKPLNFPRYTFTHKQHFPLCSRQLQSHRPHNSTYINKQLKNHSNTAHKSRRYRQAQTVRIVISLNSNPKARI